MGLIVVHTRQDFFRDGRGKDFEIGGFQSTAAFVNTFLPSRYANSYPPSSIFKTSWVVRGPSLTLCGNQQIQLFGKSPCSSHSI